MFFMGKIGDCEYYVISEKNLHNAKSAQDYLNGSGAKADFVGCLLKDVEYSAKSYENLYNGFMPDGKKILKRQDKNHKAGVDIVQALPKDFSILYASADCETRKKLDDLVKNVFVELIDKEFSKRLKPSCQKKEYRKQLNEMATKIAGAMFTHYENRNQDPHYHIHFTLFNFAEFEFEDGKKQKFAVDTKELFASQKYLSALFDYNLTEKLRSQFNIETELNENGFNVVGVDEVARDELSARRNEVVSFIENKRQENVNYSSYSQAEEEFNKAEYAKYKEKVRRGTANSKEELNYNELMELHKNKLEKLGVSYSSIIEKNRLHYQNYRNVGKIFRDCVSEIVNTAGFFSSEQLATKLLRSGVCENYLSDLEVGKIFEVSPTNKSIVRLDDDVYTTLEVIENSFGAIELAKDVLKKQFNIASYSQQFKILKEKAGSGELGLNTGQALALKGCINNDSISFVIGDAGTGKTSKIIANLNEFYSVDCEVVGLATQGKTSKSLNEASISKTFNIAEFFAINKKPSKKQLLVIDEAGMVDAVNYFKLLQYAKDNDVKIVFVGDAKQLASVGYGCMFENLTSEFKDKTFRLSQNCRQSSKEQKDIAEGFRDKDINKAFDALGKTNGLIVSNSKNDVMDLLVDSYFADLSESKIALAFKNDDVNKINDKIRNKLIESNRLNVDEQIYIDVLTSQSCRAPKERAFAVGDKIVLTGKLKQQGKSVNNGVDAVIKQIRGSKIHCSSKDGDFEFDYKEFNKFNHSYCITTHKSQGLTVENSYIFSDGKTNSNQAYVDFSRHKNKANLFIEETALEEFKKNAVVSVNKFDVLKNDIAQQAYSVMIELENKEKEYLAQKELQRSVQMQQQKQVQEIIPTTTRRR